MDIQCKISQILGSSSNNSPKDAWELLLTSTRFFDVGRWLGWNYFAKKAKTSEKSENISKAKIVLMFSQNSELDCVDSFCIRKVDLLFCKIISKSRNPRIWCNFQFAKMNCIKVDLLFCEIISKPRNPRIWCNFQFAKMNCNNIECFNKVPQWPPNSWPQWPPRSFEAVWINHKPFYTN